jgi:anti-sigma regulatory factor (Ser/Thr protein kinase)
MGALAVETLRSGTEWFPVDDATSAGSVRRAAIRLATRLGFTETRAAEVGIVASEVATNVHRHAHDGCVGIQVVLRAGLAGVQIIAFDRGPGMDDLPASSLDGHSTSGTLGVGLGAIGRLSSTVDVSSAPGIGTVLAAQLWAGPRVLAEASDVGGVTRPITGETVCGDAIAGRETDGHLVVIVSDGLGHGPLAMAASQEAVRAFHDSIAVEPLVVLKEIHARLGHTRGAAIAVASVDPSYRRFGLAGIGNVSAFLEHPERRQAIMSYPGIVGHNAQSVRQLDFEIDDDSIVVMHSDGVRPNWDLGSVPGLRRRSAAVIATTLFRDHAGRRDDASVLVIRRVR